MLKQIQSTPHASLQRSLPAGEDEVLVENLDEEPLIKDPGLEDVVESSADCTKPRGAHEESSQTTIDKSAPDGLGKMLKIWK